MACRAGKVISGEFVIEKALLKNSKSIKMILLAQDIAEATKAKYLGWSEKYRIKLVEVEFSKDELAQVIGKTDRAAIAILDQGFSKALEKILE